jgi:hypothetical protein
MYLYGYYRLVHFFLYAKISQWRFKVITDHERKIIEQEVRAQIIAERKAYKMDWRAKNKDKVRESNRKYYEKQKAKKGGT